MRQRTYHGVDNPHTTGSLFQAEPNLLSALFLWKIPMGQKILVFPGIGEREKAGHGAAWLSEDRQELGARLQDRPRVYSTGRVFLFLHEGAQSD